MQRTSTDYLTDYRGNLNRRFGDNLVDLRIVEPAILVVKIINSYRWKSVETVGPLLPGAISGNVSYIIKSEIKLVQQP